MKHPLALTAALLGLGLFGLASAAHGGQRTLFPDLRGEDFPERANQVRFEWLETTRGSLVGHAFHTRPGEMVFPSLVTAAVSVDRETGAPVLQVVRLDDDCLSFAAAIEVAPEEACLAITATSIAPGVERLTLQARFFDYQLHFYLVQSREDAAEWNLAPTGRKGEPQVLRLRTSEADGSVVADWELSYRDERNEGVAAAPRDTAGRGRAGRRSLGDPGRSRQLSGAVLRHRRFPRLAGAARGPDDR